MSSSSNASLLFIRKIVGPPPDGACGSVPSLKVSPLSPTLTKPGAAFAARGLGAQLAFPAREAFRTNGPSPFVGDSR